MEESYNAKGVDIPQLRTEVDRLWSELRTDPETQKEGRSLGINLDALSQLSHNPIEIKLKPEQGLDPLTTALIIAFAPTAAEITRDVWRHFVLPRLRHKFGEDVLRPDTDQK